MSDDKCICSGPGCYDFECPQGPGPHLVPVFAFGDNDLCMKIEVIRHHLPECRSIQLYLLELQNETGSWEEAFGSPSEAAAFVAGVRAGLSMLGKHFRLWAIPEHAHRSTEQKP